MLFGSVARGDDTKESDIDILVVSPIADEIKPKIRNVAVEFILKKDEVISLRIMSENEFDCGNYPFLVNALKDGIFIG